VERRPEFVGRVRLDASGRTDGLARFWSICRHRARLSSGMADALLWMLDSYHLLH
jgi:hypothetical protein